MRLIDIEAPCKIEIELDGEKCHTTVTAPTVDAVPVVRCKDCKWWGDIDPKNRYTDCYCHVVECCTESDWFCADGKWKDDESHPFADDVMMGD